jgi:hypothetical protein
MDLDEPLLSWTILGASADTVTAYEPHRTEQMCRPCPILNHSPSCIIQSFTILFSSTMAKTIHLPSQGVVLLSQFVHSLGRFDVSFQFGDSL